MHEMSIAGSMLEIVRRHAGGRQVTRVELRVGHLRQIVPDALGFAFGIVARGTEAAGAELVMQEVPACVRCATCGAESELAAFPARCQACGSADVKVEGGDELLVQSLELEEPGAA